MEKETRRTVVMLVIGATLSYVLALAGHRITYHIFWGGGADDKQGAINILLVEAFIVLPLVSLLVGMFVGWLDRDGHWWAAGASMTPLLGYILYRASFGPVIILCLTYAAVSMAASMLIMGLRKKLKSLEPV